MMVWWNWTLLVAGMAIAIPIVVGELAVWFGLFKKDADDIPPPVARTAALRAEEFEKAGPEPDFRGPQ
jgi:hypothetical protein